MADLLPASLCIQNRKKKKKKKKSTKRRRKGQQQYEESNISQEFPADFHFGLVGLNGDARPLLAARESVMNRITVRKAERWVWAVSWYDPGKTSSSA